MKWAITWLIRLFLLIAFPLLLISGVSSSSGVPAESKSSQNRPVFNEQANMCQIDSGAQPFPDAGYCFLQGLIQTSTGLVASREMECFTTVYKTSLAAMAFIHQSDIGAAEKIFDFFQGKLTNPFDGFLQAWDPCNGQPINDPNNTKWEGDNAFLLLALNYYAQSTGSYGKYSNLANVLRSWLTGKANSCDPIVAEGVANMYAALVPFGNDWSNWQTLSRLHWCFFNSVDYSGVADHIVRGALVFGDTNGFNSSSNFKRAEAWQCNESTVVQAYAAFASQNSINVEISTQLLLAWKLWQHELSTDLSLLRSELEKLRLLSNQTPMCLGLPYLVRHPNSGGFANDYSLPIVDPTIYLLYDSWSFNPFAPGKMNAGCRSDQFVSLRTKGQQQGFPRLFIVNQNLVSQFPQEINNGNHKNIVIQFTSTSTQSLFTVPLTLTIDTVARENFGLVVKLDDGDHCLVGLEPDATYGPNSAEVAIIPLAKIIPMPYRIYLPIVRRAGATTPPAQIYQLVVEGVSGWGVFDWLQLDSPNGVLWTIGNKDDRCNEFDKNGFTYPCN